MKEAIIGGAIGGLVVAVLTIAYQEFKWWWGGRKFLKGCVKGGSKDDGPDYTKAA